MAYARLGQVYANIGTENLAIENSNKAFSLHDRVSERERFYIDAAPLPILSPGKREKTVRVLEQWREAYPREAAPARTLTWKYHGFWGDIAGCTSRGWRSSASGSRLAYHHRHDLAFSLITLNRLDEAQAALNEMKDLSGSGNMHKYVLAFLRG